MFGKIISVLGIKSAVTHFIDKSAATVKEPKVGSVLYTGLLADMMEHTGVYIGNGSIIELNSDGSIVEVTPEEFVDGGTGINIYVSCQGQHPVGSSLIAERAIKYEREVGCRDYNLLLDNCHMFTSSCITGNEDNANSFLWMVKDLAKDTLGTDSWLVWKNPQSCEYQTTKPKAGSPDDVDMSKTIDELNLTLDEIDQIFGFPFSKVLEDWNLSFDLVDTGKTLDELKSGSEEWWKMYMEKSECLEGGVFQGSGLVEKNPIYTQDDLIQVEIELNACRAQSRTLWSDIKQRIEKRRKHSENGPTTWFYTTDSRLDRYQQELMELEQLEDVNRRKHDDLAEEESALEKKVEKIKVFLSNK